MPEIRLGCGRRTPVDGAVKTLDRYVLREWLSVLGLVASLTVGLLLIQALYDDFRDLSGMGAPLGDLALYFAVKIPSYLAVVLPIIVLVSLLYTLGQLHRCHEITAMRAAGLGFLRITRSIWAMGLLMCGLMWYLNASVVPWSVEASRAIFETIELRFETASAKDQSGVGMVRGVTFDNRRDGRIWIINRYSRLAQRAYGVSVTEFNPSGKETRRVFAKEAVFDVARGCWVFRGVWVTEFDAETGEVSHPPPVGELVMTAYREDPGLMLIFDLKPGDLSFFELRRLISHFEAEKSPKVLAYSMRYYGLLADTLAPLIVILIGVSFSMTGVRVNPAVGVSKAMGLFAVYYLCLQGANAIGARGLVDPMIAACAPSLVMLSIGGWYFLRLR
ncbi:LptF/LptG family permease [Nibricoccus sp. IMCC34717]|uniref:LptF/LptG family permease n=1 Tax=Nibricoccus sp. IMCC34717 TaxID=3034021 RepID=UPI00384FB758